MRKVKIFCSEHSWDLEEVVNKFAERHKIIDICYSNRGPYNCCMVLYEV